MHLAFLEFVKSVFALPSREDLEDAPNDEQKLQARESKYLLQKALLDRRCRLQDRIIESQKHCDALAEKPRPSKPAYAGHLIQLGRALEEFRHATLASDEEAKLGIGRIPQTEEWKEFVQGPLSDALARHAIVLGGSSAAPHDCHPILETLASTADKVCKLILRFDSCGLRFVDAEVFCGGNDLGS